MGVLILATTLHCTRERCGCDTWCSIKFRAIPHSADVHTSHSASSKTCLVCPGPALLFCSLLCRFALPRSHSPRCWRSPRSIASRARPLCRWHRSWLPLTRNLCSLSPQVPSLTLLRTSRCSTRKVMTSQISPSTRSRSSMRLTRPSRRALHRPLARPTLLRSPTAASASTCRRRTVAPPAIRSSSRPRSPRLRGRLHTPVHRLAPR